jgi:signal transduction histidine kinase
MAGLLAAGSAGRVGHPEPPGNALAERERIARELHDTLLQGFQGLTLRFQTIMEGLPLGQPARREVDKALELADGLLVSGGERERHLGGTGGASDPAEALAEAGQSMSESLDSGFRFIVEGAPRAIHNIVAEELEAIGRETPLKAVQHARARRVRASLIYDRHALVKRIDDDGVGIYAEILTTGGRADRCGLVGMRERAEQIEGRLAVFSRPEAGCAIAVSGPAQFAFAEAAASQAWGAAFAVCSSD